jgi:hypothetical protein
MLKARSEESMRLARHRGIPPRSEVYPKNFTPDFYFPIIILIFTYNLKHMKYTEKELELLKDFTDGIESEIRSDLEESLDRLMRYGNKYRDEFIDFNQEVKEYLEDDDLFEYVKDWGEENDLSLDEVLEEFDWTTLTQELAIPRAFI